MSRTPKDLTVPWYEAEWRPLECRSDPEHQQHWLAVLRGALERTSRDEVLHAARSRHPEVSKAARCELTRRSRQGVPRFPPLPQEGTIARLIWFAAMAEVDPGVEMREEDANLWAANVDALVEALLAGHHPPLTVDDLEPLLTSCQARIRQDAMTHLVPWVAL